MSQDIVSTTSYSGEDAFSMKPEYYTVPLDVFRLVRKEDKWPINGHKKPDIPIPYPPDKTLLLYRANPSSTSYEKEKKVKEEFHNIDENCNKSTQWIRTNFIIQK